MTPRLRRIFRRLWITYPTETILTLVIMFVVAWGGTQPIFWRWLRTEWKAYHETTMDALVIAAFLLSLVAHLAIEKLRRTTSTRFIGEFPDHLGKIITAIRTAAVRIDGLADCVDYGSFFRPEAFEQLRQCIQNAHEKNKVSVRIVVCGEPQAISAASALWRCSLEDRLRDAEFRNRLTDYLEVLKHEETGYKDFWKECLAADAEYYACVQKCLDGKFQSGDDPAFDRLLLARQAWFVRRFSDPGVQIKKHDDPSDVFFWIVDGIEAVFLFAYPQANALAFSTCDPALLRVLNSVFEARLAGSKEYPKGVPVSPSDIASVASTAI